MTLCAQLVSEFVDQVKEVPLSVAELQVSLQFQCLPPLCCVSLARSKSLPCVSHPRSLLALVVSWSGLLYVLQEQPAVGGAEREQGARAAEAGPLFRPGPPLPAYFAAFLQALLKWLRKNAEADAATATAAVAKAKAATESK
jgi:hypothetical protein